METVNNVIGQKNESNKKHFAEIPHLSFEIKVCSVKIFPLYYTIYCQRHREFTRDKITATKQVYLKEYERSSYICPIIKIQ